MFSNKIAFRNNVLTTSAHMQTDTALLNIILLAQVLLNRVYVSTMFIPLSRLQPITDLPNKFSNKCGIHFSKTITNSR